MNVRIPISFVNSFQFMGLCTVESLFSSYIIAEKYRRCEVGNVSDQQLPKEQDAEKPERLFDNWLWGKPFQHITIGNLLDSLDHLFRTSQLKPAFRVKVDETKDYYVVTAELPGVKKENIHIKVLSNSLTISVEKYESQTMTDDINNKVEKSASFEKVSRTIPLYQPIDENKTKANYQNGLLTIKLKKAVGKSIHIDG